MSANIITVRTLSQLPRITDYNNISADTLFEVCPKSGDKYQDKGVDYSVLSARINSDVGNPIDTKLMKMSELVNNITNGDTNFSGQKTFNEMPILKVEGTGYEFVTRRDVKDIMASESIGFINSTQTITHMSMDSTFTDKHTGWTELSATGNMYVYGWLADNGNVPPAQAWVALEAEINGAAQKIALCPWSISSYSKQLGYVSFNVPVAAGLNVRIATGFIPNMTVSGSQNVAGSLTDGKGTACGFRTIIYSNA